ncbi:MAG: hypothetical protein JJT75_07260 [Opitutales bacterium]|nr:hypothetical protein [Opitutales bacterium]MCH8540827.1 hypothetical protein [Opitutales bacterium]
MAKVRSTLMRSNRRLGAALVENNLVDITELESANEKLLDLVAEGINRRCSILSLLVWEMSALEERKLIEFQNDELKVPPLDLTRVEIDDELYKAFDPKILWATWTLPFNKVDGFYCMASCYYLSPAAREFWEQELDGKLLWYVSPMMTLADKIEEIEKNFEENNTAED